MGGVLGVGWGVGVEDGVGGGVRDGRGVGGGGFGWWWGLKHVPFLQDTQWT